MEARFMACSEVEIFQIEFSEVRNIFHCSIVDVCNSGLYGSVHGIFVYEETEKVLDTTGIELNG
jgi:hypothetical protein